MTDAKLILIFRPAIQAARSARAATLKPPSLSRGAHAISQQKTKESRRKEENDLRRLEVAAKNNLADSQRENTQVLRDIFSCDESTLEKDLPSVETFTEVIKNAFGMSSGVSVPNQSDTEPQELVTLARETFSTEREKFLKEVEETVYSKIKRHVNKNFVVLGIIVTVIGTGFAILGIISIPDEISRRVQSSLDERSTRTTDILLKLSTALGAANEKAANLEQRWITLENQVNKRIAGMETSFAAFLEKADREIGEIKDSISARSIRIRLEEDPSQIGEMTNQIRISLAEDRRPILDEDQADVLSDLSIIVSHLSSNGHREEVDLLAQAWIDNARHYKPLARRFLWHYGWLVVGTEEDREQNLERFLRFEDISGEMGLETASLPFRMVLNTLAENEDIAYANVKVDLDRFYQKAFLNLNAARDFTSPFCPHGIVIDGNSESSKIARDNMHKFAKRFPKKMDDIVRIVYPNYPSFRSRASVENDKP